jgi:hypothetical protein
MAAFLGRGAQPLNQSIGAHNLLSLKPCRTTAHPRPKPSSTPMLRIRQLALRLTAPCPSQPGQQRSRRLGDAETSALLSRSPGLTSAPPFERGSATADGRPHVREAARNRLFVRTASVLAHKMCDTGQRVVARSLIAGQRRAVAASRKVENCLQSMTLRPPKKAVS